MRAVIYGSNRIRTLAALADGLEQNGQVVIWREDRDAYQANQGEPNGIDLAITEGIRGPMGVMLEEYNASGIPVLISDAGFIRRDLKYFQLGINRLNWFPEDDLPGDRWARLGVDLQPRHDGGYILITGQKPGDAAHNLGHLALQDLYQEWTQELRRLTPLEVRFRPHPFAPDLRIDGAVTIPGIPLQEELAQAYAVVTWNSTTATDAMIAGTPIFVLGPNAQAERLASTSLENIETPYFPTDRVREGFFNRVAWGQWQLEEFRDGSALEFMLEAIRSQGPDRDLAA